MRRAAGSGSRLAPADSSPASGTDGDGDGVLGCRDAGDSMRRSQNDSTSVRESKDSTERQQQHHRHLSTPVGIEQQIGRRMSLETLLQAAYYVEQEEKKRERLASTSSSSSSCDQHSFAPAPTHSNHAYASGEPRGEYHAPLLRRPFMTRHYDEMQWRYVALRSYDRTRILPNFAKLFNKYSFS